MNDIAKYLLAGAAGYAAAVAYQNYRAEQAQAALAQRGTAGRLTDLAMQAGRETGLVNGMAGHMAMPHPPPAGPNSFHGQAMRQAVLPPHASNAFYGQSGMRQSGSGNPHAPVVVPSRPRAVPPPPPPPPPSAPNGNSNGTGAAEFESYGGDSMMGGQRF
jgi:hypothetical protein